MAAPNNQEAVTKEHELVARSGELPDDFSVKDFVQADDRLTWRESEGAVISLWVVRATSARYVTVEDYRKVPEGKAPPVQRIDPPEYHDPFNKNYGVYWHPQAFL